MSSDRIHLMSRHQKAASIWRLGGASTKLCAIAGKLRSFSNNLAAFPLTIKASYCTIPKFITIVNHPRDIAKQRRNESALQSDYLGLESGAELDVKVSLRAGMEAKEHIMVERDGYIPHTIAAMAINEFCLVLGGQMGLENGVGEALMASRIDMLKAVDQCPELQNLIEQLVLRATNYFTDQDYEGV